MSKDWTPKELRVASEMMKANGYLSYEKFRSETLAQEIYKWLISHLLWIDTNIYYNGKCMSTYHNGKFRYNGKPFITEADPSDYFDYVADPHILSMSFEGPLYSILNGSDFKLAEEFRQLLDKHGVYYELGNSWNLTCFEK